MKILILVALLISSVVSSELLLPAQLPPQLSVLEQYVDRSLRNGFLNDCGKLSVENFIDLGGRTA